MRAHFHRESAIGVRRFHREGSALDARLFGIGGVVNLDGVLVPVRPANVHAHQHFGPVGGVHTARAGADIDQRLTLVVLAGEQGADLHGLHIAVQRGPLGVGVGKRGRPGLALFFLGQFVQDGQIVEALAQFLDPAQLALGMRQLAGDLLCVLLVVPQIGIGGLVLELIDPSTQLLDIEDRLDGLECGVEFGEVSGDVRMHDGQDYWASRRR